MDNPGRYRFIGIKDFDGDKNRHLVSKGFDPTWARAQAALANGKKDVVDLYHYLQPEPGADQARVAITLLTNKGVIKPVADGRSEIAMPGVRLALDVEEPGVLNNLGIVGDYERYFSARVLNQHAQPEYPDLYTSKSFAPAVAAQAPQALMWEAVYGSAPDPLMDIVQNSGGDKAHGDPTNSHLDHDFLLHKTQTQIREATGLAPACGPKQARFPRHERGTGHPRRCSRFSRSRIGPRRRRPPTSL